MPSRTLLFDHFCKPLTEINVASTPRNYILNGYGRCEFTIATSDPKCKEKYLQYGNLVLIQHLPDNVDEQGYPIGKLPDWCGVILPPRTWDKGMSHVNVYSAEAVLFFRAMPFQAVQGTPSQVFRQILGFAQQATNNIVVQQGVIEDVSKTYSDELRLSAYDHIQKMQKNTGIDWNVSAEINEKGNLELFGNLYEKLGVKTNLTLTDENTELISPSMTEQGTPSNYVIGYSQATTAANRLSAIGIHQGALDDYGMMQMNETYNGIHDVASVESAAKARAAYRGRPVKLFRRNALDVRDTFSCLAPGNIVHLKDAESGFAADGGFGTEADCRILSVDYNDLVNKCPLNLEVV